MHHLSKKNRMKLKAFMAVVPENIPLNLLEYAIINAVLQRTGGNRTHTSNELGVCLRTVRNKIREMEKLGFEIPDPLSGIKRF